MKTSVLALLLCASAPASAVAQGPTNLLADTAAERITDTWRIEGHATVEEFDGNHCFVVRNGAKLQQRVELPPSASGQYALFIAHVSGERTAPEAGITDRPYLYGLTFSADGRRIVSYNQANTMRSLATRSNEWTKAWGIFRIPDGASSISYQLGQALRRGVPHDGSAARFDDVGLFVFETREAAEAFVTRYR